MGNALAETTIRIAKAQSVTKQFWQTEQPDFLLMWCLTEMLSLEPSAWKAVWTKPWHCNLQNVVVLNYWICAVIVAMTTQIGCGHQ